MPEEDPMEPLRWGLKWFVRIVKVILCFLAVEILVLLWLIVSCISKAAGEKVWSFIDTVRHLFGF